METVVIKDKNNKEYNFKLGLPIKEKLELVQYIIGECTQDSFLNFINPIKLDVVTLCCVYAKYCDDIVITPDTDLFTLYDEIMNSGLIVAVQKCKEVQQDIDCVIPYIMDFANKVDTYRTSINCFAESLVAGANGASADFEEMVKTIQSDEFKNTIQHLDELKEQL